MGYESDSSSHDGHDEDDEEESEEAGGSNRLLGFMFGNVDDSGDLDADYLDEDAKEHLAALADKLGSSLDIDLSVRSPQTPGDATDQDYDRKAENAVNYEDIDEQYEGPEIEASTEEDFLLPKKEFFAKEGPLTTLRTATSVFDDENYDEEDDDLAKQNGAVGSISEVEQCSPSVMQNYTHEMLSQNESHPEDTHTTEMQHEMLSQNEGLPADTHTSVMQHEMLSQNESLPADTHTTVLQHEMLSSNESLPEHTHTTEMQNLDLINSDEDGSIASEESEDGDRSSLLPVLYVEDGKAILRFSEIFGVQEPIKKAGKRESRYFIPKEKYMCMNASDMVEEDEENSFREPARDFSWMRPFHTGSDVAMGDDQGDSISGAVQGSEKMSSGVADHRKDYVSAEPMKRDCLNSPPSEWNSTFSAELYNLDQQDWEDRIIWNNSPSSTENFVESCELSGPDSDTLADKGRDFESGEHPFESELRNELHDKDNRSFVNSSISVEPFGAKEYLHSTCLPITENRSHPQLLRLESRLDKDNLNSSVSKDFATEAKLCSNVLNRFSQLSLQNRDVLEGSWLDKIVWEQHQPIEKPKLILNLQDQQMLFELSDVKDAHLQLHAGAMIMARSVLAGSGDIVESHGHGIPSAGRFNISNDKFYSNRKSSQQLRSHSKKRSVHGLKVLHSVPALKLQTMKAKLSNKDIANFHRPKALWYPHDIEVPFKELGKPAMQGPMKIIMKSLGGKGSKLHVDAEETVSSVKAKASKKLDFKLAEPVKIFYSGRELEDDKSLAEQNVQPNSVLHLIRTKIHLLSRAQKLPGENKSLRPPGAFKKKSDLSVKDGHVFLMEYCEERPLLLGNAGMGARLCTYYQKSGPGDQTGNLLRNGNNGLGSIFVLDPADKSPFLGDIKHGSSQSSLETNMYRAPIFQHKVPSTDYLLVRSSKGKLSIRRIDRIDVAGQQEPHMEVMNPGSKGVQFYIMNRLLVYMFREFRGCEKRGLRPSIRSDELFQLFPSLSEAFLRKRLKTCAELQKGPHGQFLWVMKRNFRIPSEEELRRMVTPENVCAYESMQAGLYRLKRLGITSLTQPSGLSSAMNQLPDEAITLAAASHIERELQITPWNLSSNFVSCTNQDRENIERLEITGVGDPSGRGLGFSYVRTTPKAPISNTMVKKKTVVGKGTTVTGTDADLRRLSMDAARELLLKFNLPDEQIAKLSRWHRIAMIRKLSSEQAASGVKVDPTTITKFARGQRMSFLQLQQQTREKCQEIWDRQVQTLCSADTEENESESEANSDLDSFAGDLESLLDEEREEDNYDSKHDSVDGFKGLKMRRRPFQTQAQEEIEDEAAEAAELCRLLMEEDETERKKKKKARDVVVQVVTPFKSKFGPEDAQGAKTYNIVPTRITQPEGSFVQSENASKDQREVQGEISSSKKYISGKLKPKKKNEIEQTGLLNKKVKILGDGITVIKEKKSARESFVCGACGQLGHMRTNKECPKYKKDSEPRRESLDREKTPGKPSSANQPEQIQQRPPKKLTAKSTPKFTGLEASEDDRPKAKTLKVKCGTTDKVSDKPTPSTSQTSDRPVITDTGKVNKIVFSKKMKPEEVPVESHRPAVVIKPPVEADSREQPRKKIIIRQPKEIINLDDNSQDGFVDSDHRKIKKITELSSSDRKGENKGKHFLEESSRRTEDIEGSQWWVEDKMRIGGGHKEERNSRKAEKMQMLEQQQTYHLYMYGESLRREKEEEDRKKATAKNKKKRKLEPRDDYLDDFPPRRNDRRMPERDGPRRRSAVEHPKHVQDYGQASKRRRGGEVEFSNILEGIVDSLKERKEISYLFLKPVTKKEAPDYLNFVDRPMDLSKIRDKVRRMEYRNREEFRRDVWQITYNAHRYNDGRHPGIPPLADQLLELCDFMLQQFAAELDEAEEGIQ